MRKVLKNFLGLTKPKSDMEPLMVSVLLLKTELLVEAVSVSCITLPTGVRLLENFSLDIGMLATGYY